MNTRRSLLRTALALPAALHLAPARADSGYRLTPMLLERPWTDSDGRTMRLADVAGEPVVMTMSYAGCRRTCSTTMLVLADLQKALDARGESWRFVIVSFDPDNDSPAVWTDYRRLRGLTRPNWHFLSGSERDTRRLARYLDLDYWSYHGHPMHDFRVVLYGPDFRFVREIDWSGAQQLEATLRKL